jgi:uncharacterized protein (DUF362 family)
MWCYLHLSPVAEAAEGIYEAFNCMDAVMKTSVTIVKGEYTSELLDAVLDMVGARKLIDPREKVLIKPNCVVAKPSSTGLTTDSRVIENIIEFVKRLGI